MKLSTRTFISSVAICAVAVTGLSACGDDRPSKSAVTKHTVSFIKKESGGLATEKQLTTIFGCMYNSVYDDLSTDTLKKIMKTDDTDGMTKLIDKATKKEKNAFDKAEKDCEDEANKALGQN